MTESKTTPWHLANDGDNASRWLDAARGAAPRTSPFGAHVSDEHGLPGTGCIFWFATDADRTAALRFAVPALYDPDDGTKSALDAAFAAADGAVPVAEFNRLLHGDAS